MFRFVNIMRTIRCKIENTENTLKLMEAPSSHIMTTDSCA